MGFMSKIKNILFEEEEIEEPVKEEVVAEPVTKKEVIKREVEDISVYNKKEKQKWV